MDLKGSGFVEEDEFSAVDQQRKISFREVPGINHDRSQEKALIQTVKRKAGNQTKRSSNRLPASPG